MTRRRISFMVVLPVAMMTLSGCSGSSHPDTDVLMAGQVAVLKETEPFTGAVGGQGVDGTLSIVEGCVGLVGVPPRVIVFPPSTEVEGEGDALVLTVDGLELRIGDRFEAGTRGSTTSTLQEYGDLATQAPESCRDQAAVQLDGFN